MGHKDHKKKNKKYDSVLTVKEMIDYLKISKTFAYKLLESNQIPHIKFGKIYRILKEDLDDYCRSKRVTSKKQSKPLIVDI